jgi:hypothetical protein
VQLASRAAVVTVTPACAGAPFAALTGGAWGGGRVGEGATGRPQKVRNTPPNHPPLGRHVRANVWLLALCCEHLATVRGGLGLGGSWGLVGDVWGCMVQCIA